MKKILHILFLFLPGTFSFASPASVVLYSIALQNPLYSGDAVYSARVMLDLIVYDEPTSQRLMAEQQYISDDMPISKIYPNPSDGNMQMDYQLPEGAKGELTIYDMTGRKINSYQIAGAGTVQVNESNLEAGIYIYEVKINGEIKGSDKLIIIK